LLQNVVKLSTLSCTSVTIQSNMECGAGGANCRVRAYGTGTSYWEVAEVGARQQ